MNNRSHTPTLIEQLSKYAAEFVSRESNRTSLITITNTHLNDARDHVTFFVSVFPESAEGPALGFLLRKRGECRAHIKAHVPIAHIPHVEFAIDEGEKHRRRVDELLKG